MKVVMATGVYDSKKKTMDVVISNVHKDVSQLQMYALDCDIILARMS